MNDDLNTKIKQITDILGQDNVPDSVKGLLSLLTAPPTKDESPQKANDTPSPSTKEDRTNTGEFEDSIEMFSRMRKIMDRLKSNDDPRLGLLTAIKPFLNSKRQKKLHNCIRLISMSSVIRLMDESDKAEFKL